MTAEIDVVELAASVMERRGYKVTRSDAWLEHPDSGFSIRAELLETQLSQSLVRSALAVTMRHPQLLPAAGILEFQHAVAATLKEAVCNGFDQWLQLDFSVLLDALREQAEQCMSMQWTIQRDGEAPELIRRALEITGGHQSRAAKLLGMNNTTLNSKIKVYNIRV